MHCHSERSEESHIISILIFFLRSFSFFVSQAKKENEPKERNSALLKELLKSLYENFRSQEPVNFLQILKNL